MHDHVGGQLVVDGYDATAMLPRGAGLGPQAAIPEVSLEGSERLGLAFGKIAATVLGLRPRTLKTLATVPDFLKERASFDLSRLMVLRAASSCEGAAPISRHLLGWLTAWGAPGSGRLRVRRWQGRNIPPRGPEGWASSPWSPLYSTAGSPPSSGRCRGLRGLIRVCAPWFPAPHVGP